MNREDAIAEIRSAPLRGRTDELVTALVPRARIRAERDSAVAERLVSRLGGNPLIAAYDGVADLGLHCARAGLDRGLPARIAETKRFGRFEQTWLEHRTRSC